MIYLNIAVSKDFTGTMYSIFDFNNYVKFRSEIYEWFLTHDIKLPFIQKVYYSRTTELDIVGYVKILIPSNIATLLLLKFDVYIPQLVIYENN